MESAEKDVDHSHGKNGDNESENSHHHHFPSLKVSYHRGNGKKTVENPDDEGADQFRIVIVNICIEVMEPDQTECHGASEDNECKTDSGDGHAFDGFQRREFFIDNAETRRLHFVIQHKVEKAVHACDGDRCIAEQSCGYMKTEKKASQDFRNLCGVLNKERRHELEKKCNIQNKVTGFCVTCSQLDHQIGQCDGECEDGKYLEYAGDRRM